MVVGLSCGLDEFVVYTGTLACISSCIFSYVQGATDQWSRRELALLAMQICTVIYHKYHRIQSDEVIRKSRGKISEMDAALREKLNELSLWSTAIRTMTGLLQQTFYANREVQKEISAVEDSLEKAQRDRKTALRVASGLSAAKIRQAMWLRILVGLAGFPSVVSFFSDSCTVDTSIVGIVVAFLALVLAFTTIECQGVGCAVRLPKRRTKLAIVHNLHNISAASGEDDTCEGLRARNLLVGKGERCVSRMVMADIEYIVDMSATRTNFITMMGDRKWSSGRRALCMWPTTLKQEYNEEFNVDK